GIVVAGALFPELRRWHRAFARRLWDEIPRQCRADGTHYESSTGYQRLCAEMFLAALLASRAADLPAPAAVEGAVRGLFRSLSATLNPSGNMPQIGDLDSCRALPLAPRAALDASFLAEAAAPEWQWLPAAREYVAPRPARSVLLPDAGFAVLRKGDAWLCLGSGPKGQGGTGGHAHNDKNSVELSFGAFDVLVDRGTFVYARDPAERDARRSTAAHSTVQVDALEQNRIVPGRLFALPDTAQARLARMERREGFEQATGQHHGYASAGIVHRRVAALREDCAAFVDELRGHGKHLFDARWFVPHDAALERPATAEERARLSELHERGLSFGYDLERCVEVGGKALFAFGATLPWSLRVERTDVSPGYAEKRPARCLSLRLKGAAPLRLFTAVLFLPRR
ncbi:MAG TPA: alginate lyase family protein, partial [Myxococcales bacterium]|nr:alginate lyase family protein [Myxococcales bacterium]